MKGVQINVAIVMVIYSNAQNVLTDITKQDGIKINFQYVSNVLAIVKNVIIHYLDVLHVKIISI